MSDMVIFDFPAIVALVIAIIVLHVVSAVLQGRAAVAVIVLCIALHIVIIPLMLVSSVPLDEVVAVFMTSVFAYTLSRFIAYEIRRRRK